MDAWPRAASLRWCRRLLAAEIRERLQKAREFHRENKFRGWARAEDLKRLEILKAHRVHIERLCDFEDLSEREGIAFGAQNRGLLVAFGLEDGRLLFAVG